MEKEENGPCFVCERLAKEYGATVSQCWHFKFPETANRNPGGVFVPCRVAFKREERASAAIDNSEFRSNMLGSPTVEVHVSSREGSNFLQTVGQIDSLMLRTLDFQRRLLDVLHGIFRQFYILFETEAIQLFNSKGRIFFCSGCDCFYGGLNKFLNFDNHLSHCDRKRCSSCMKDCPMTPFNGALTRAMDVADNLNHYRGFSQYCKSRPSCSVKITNAEEKDHSMDVQKSSKVPENLIREMTSMSPVIRSSNSTFAALNELKDELMLPLPFNTESKAVIQYVKDLRNKVAHQEYTKKDAQGNSEQRNEKFNEFLWGTNSVAELVVNAMRRFFQSIASIHGAPPIFKTATEIVEAQYLAFSSIRCKWLAFVAISRRERECATWVPPLLMRDAAIGALQEALQALTEDTSSDVCRGERQQHFAGHIFQQLVGRKGVLERGYLDIFDYANLGGEARGTVHRLADTGAMIRHAVAEEKLQRIAAEYAAKERIAQERIAAEQAAQERIAQERIAAEYATKERIVRETIAAEQAAQKRIVVTEEATRSRRIKSLNKKLREIELLKTHRDAGNVLSIEEVQKIENESSIRTELSTLHAYA
jgi:hypothetical protein